MKKFFLLLILITFFGCREDAVQYSLEQSTANVFVSSFPPKAKIYLNNTATGLVTPDTLKYLEPGAYLLTLKLSGFKDSTVNIAVQPEDRQNVFISLSTK